MLRHRCENDPILVQFSRGLINIAVDSFVYCANGPVSRTCSN
jgi:hypothetical protein